MMEHRCILCGKTHPAGLNIGGCFLCFPCEHALSLPHAAQAMRRRKRRRLLQLYLSPSPGGRVLGNG